MDTYELLNSITHQMYNAESFEEVIWGLQYDIMKLLNAERITVYRRDKKNQTIVSSFKSGSDIDSEIILPLSPSSIAGYVAMSQESIVINDVNDSEYLSNIHPSLSFEHTYDQQTEFSTRSMMVVPILFKNILLGVFQVINAVDPLEFSAENLENAKKVAEQIGEKFRYHLQSTLGPYDYLIKRKKITIDELEEFEIQAEEENIPMTQIIIAETPLTEEDVGMSFEQYYQVPFFKYNPDITPQNVFMENLNVDYLAGHLWLPIAGDQKNVIVLIDDPSDTERIMEIQSLLNAETYEFMVALQEDILKYLGRGSGQTIEAPEMNFEELLGEIDGITTEDEEESEGTSQLLDENASSIIQLVNRIIVDGIDMGASDIHIEPHKGKNPADVRMRVDGVCSCILQIPAGIIRAVVSRVKVLSRLDITETRKPQDGKMAVRYGELAHELRIATLPTVNGESIVMRILASGDPLPFSKLNLSKKNESKIEKMLEIPHGLFLVVGPTGSGKTTTLHAILGKINTPDKKILTAEDPVEITQPGLQQVQMQAKIGLDFAAALRSFLRCDPDVILIGEMRDYETAHSGIEASLTGHQVYSTLHTNSAPETITRLLDMGLEPINFADALIGVLAQRLMRTLCAKCKEAYTPKREEMERLIKAYGKELFEKENINLSTVEFYRAKGCKKCADTGYKGRTGLHELLEGTVEMRRLIAKGADVSDVRDLAIKEGMRTMAQDGILKIFKGQTDLLQLRKVTSID
ncbi:MAG: GspE/PulE family protein [Verrucomicrobiota bacterium]|nr:GspE/PulE family protein [Verrucomicrobiota bacterium]